MILTAILMPRAAGGFTAFNPETSTNVEGDSANEALSNLRASTIQRLREQSRPIEYAPLIKYFEVSDDLDQPDESELTRDKGTLLNLEQRKELTKMLYRAFILLRSPGYSYFWKGKEGWKDLAQVQNALNRSIAFGEALHNVPGDLFSGIFNFDFHIDKVSAYLSECPDLTNFVEDLQRIKSMGNDSRGQR